MKSQRRDLLIFILFIMSILVAYYLQYLLGAATFFSADHSLFFEPIARYIGERMRNGQVPLWNQFPGCGQSQLAVVSPGVFYPPNWIFAFISYSQAVAVQMVLHQTLAAAGAFLLIKHWRWGTTAAATGGCLVALSGYMFSLSQNITLVSTAAWLPLSVYCVQRAAETGKRGRLIAMAVGAVSIACMLAAGRPEIWAPGLGVVSVVAVVQAVRAGQPRQSIVAAVCALVPIAAGILMAMPSLLPAMEWAPLSPRSAFGSFDSLMNSASWYDFLGLLLPQALGNMSRLGNPLLPLARGYHAQDPLVLTVFVGPAAFNLAALAIADRSWRYRWLALGVLIIFVVIAAGSNLPIMPGLMGMAPWLNVMRYPVKLMFFVVAMIAVLSARGTLTAVEQPQLSRRVMKMLACIWGVLTVGALWLHAFPQTSFLGFQEFASHYVGAAANQALSALAKSCFIWSFIGLSMCACLLLSCRLRCTNSTGGGLANFAQAIFLAGALASLMFVAWNYTQLPGEAQFYQRPCFVAEEIDTFAGPHKIAPRMVHLLPEPLLTPGTYHAPKKPQDREAIAQFRRQLGLCNICMDMHLGSVIAYEGAVTKPQWIYFQTVLNEHILHAKVAEQQILSRVLRLTSCRYVFTQIYSNEFKSVALLDPSLFTLKTAAEFLNLRIYETNRCLPFAYFISNWRWTSCADESVKLVLSTAPDKLDPATCVLLSRDATALEDIGKLGQPGQKEEKLLPIDPDINEPEHMRLRVTAPDKGVVVVNDSFYPGWQATIDGQPARIFCANGVFKALLVSAGSHTIDLEFKPDVFMQSLRLLLLGILLLSGALSAVHRGICDRPPVCRDFNVDKPKLI
jgi:hypothetical protein